MTCQKANKSLKNSMPKQLTNAFGNDSIYFDMTNSELKDLMDEEWRKASGRYFIELGTDLLAAKADLRALPRSGRAKGKGAVRRTRDGASVSGDGRGAYAKGKRHG